MKRWCLIEEFATFQKVKFYTIRFEDENMSETDKFFSAFDADANMRRDLDMLVSFLQQMGEIFGARSEFFRHEGEADGLPPKSRIAKQYGLLEFVEYDFRLYCMRISDNIVILFNGSLKTTESYGATRQHHRLGTHPIHRPLRQACENHQGRHLCLCLRRAA